VPRTKAKGSNVAAGGAATTTGAGNCSIVVFERLTRPCGVRPTPLFATPPATAG
jgi:hypothetical protein